MKNELIEMFGKNIFTELETMESIGRIYRGIYRQIPFELVAFTTKERVGKDGENLYLPFNEFTSFVICKNSYVYINKNRNELSKKLFDALIETDNMDLIVFNGGVTFKDISYNENGAPYCIKIGNDYEHLHNTGLETITEVFSDLKGTIDQMLDYYRR